MPDGTTCSILRTTNELEALRPQWESLWQQDPSCTPFQSPAWLLPWWSQFGEGSMRTAAVYRSGSLAAMLPFYIYTEPGDGQRKLFPLGLATSDYLDGIFAADCCNEDILAGLECLSAEDGWDTLEVPQLRPESRLRTALQLWRPSGLLSGCGERVSRLNAVPLAQLPLKIRRNAMYYRNRAARAGALELTVATPENWPQALQSLERLHTLRWNLTGEPGVLSDARVHAWHRASIPQLLVQDSVRLYCLRLNGEIIAVLYTLADPPTRSSRSLYVYITGFSPEHSALRPGTILLALTQDHAAQQGFTTVDLLRGNETYKDLWHPRWIPIDRFMLERRSSLLESAA